MKKLWILFIVFALAFTSCEDSISKQEKRAARQRTKTEKVVTPVIEIPVEQQTSTIYYEPAPLSDDGNSYWFVVVEEKKNGKRINGWIKQEHRYFSSKELKATFNNDVFILNIVQINKETYENNE
jgi:hypothetical protein